MGRKVGKMIFIITYHLFKYMSTSDNESFSVQDMHKKIYIRTSGLREPNNDVQRRTSLLSCLVCVGLGTVD